MMMFFKKFLKIISHRVTIVIIGLALQFFWYFALILFLTSNSIFFEVLMWVVALFTVMYIINTRMDPAYKLVWTIMILAAPIVGIIFYFVMGKSRVARKYRKSMAVVVEKSRELVNQDERVVENLSEKDRTIAGQSRYLSKSVNWNCYQNTKTEYYSVGEDWFAKYLEEISKAEKYIYMEYFIIADGVMWGKVLDILKEKVKQGVDVRVIYDGVGCMTSLPNKYYKKLEEFGIKSACYSPFRPFLNIIQNNRDHRKITVIDGHTAFMGGINLADEYINERERFGHWKDSGMYLHGEAVWNLTVMFLQMWSVVSKTPFRLDEHLTHRYREGQFEGNGFVQPFGDSPLEDENVGENVYLNILSGAKKYVYIFTPYLVLDQTMQTTLCNTAKRGVDVRIVTPAVPDKKAIFALSQSYFLQLMEAGIKIYEYTPGFIHSKSFVCDDEVAAVTTINLDFRSLYLHFELGVWMYDDPAVMEVKKDALETFEISREVQIEECRDIGRVKKFWQSFLRCIAPIL